MAGLVARLLRRLAPERRALLPAFGYGGYYLNGRRVDACTVENLAPVIASIQAIAGGLASLPAYVYRREAAGRIEDPGHPVAQLIRRPNPHLTWPDFLEWILASTLLQGNGLAVIESDGAGRPTALWPVPWQYVSPVLLPSGMLAFDVNGGFRPPWGGPMITRQRFLASECLHLRDRTDDGLIGRSRLSRAWQVLDNAASLQAWSAATWENGATPTGVLELPVRMTPDAMRRLRLEFERRNAGAGNGGQPIFLDAGSKWTQLAVSPEAAQALESRRFTTEEIARLFGVPGPIIGDLTHGTFSNSEQAARSFAIHTLSVWARKVEAEFTRSVFTAEDAAHEIELDLSALVRGDWSARWSAWAIARQNDILSADEIREAEGWNPRGAPAPAAAASGATT